MSFSLPHTNSDIAGRDEHGRLQADAPNLLAHAGRAQTRKPARTRADCAESDTDSSPNRLPVSFSLPHAETDIAEIGEQAAGLRKIRTADGGSRGWHGRGGDGSSDRWN
jgi:hypothetical protein